MNEATSACQTQGGGDDEDELLAELVEEYIRRCRAGERPTVQEYATRHPALADRIRDVLPAVTAIEQEVAPVAERVGSTIGRYKLLERIGEGGFGAVYMAEQQAPLRRKVALKVIKPGVDTKQVIARFEAERQALALMDHENIAKVLDGGATESGRPYFVMELVHGVPITEYCDKNELPPRERLELFVHVCRAVQHAHMKGVIHRDIKPGNVLVTLHEGVAVPKVIDFGVAKATGQQLTEKTLFTNFAQMVGTPLYMSPEQAEMTSVDVDTRSDVYSLGVLLYELLTGTTPLDKDRLKQSAFDEIRRIIREEEPPRPSTRLSTLGHQAKTISARRKSDPAQLERLVRGELDWIVMKALEKDRRRRYETANGMARDIERYLRDDPVEACRPSQMYRLRKFARRNKAALGATILVAASLVVGTGISVWQATLAHRAKALAEFRLQQGDRQRAKAEAVSRFLEDLLSSANPDRAKGADYTVRQLLDDFSSQRGSELAGQQEVEAAIRRVIGKVYWRLGLTDRAEPQLKAALELRRATFGPDDERVAESLIDYAWNLAEGWHHQQALGLVEQAIAIYERHGSSRRQMLSAMWPKQRFLASLYRFSEADATAHAAIAMAGDLSSTDIPEVANILHALGDSLFIQGRFAEAESAARSALVLHQRLHGPNHPETAWCLWVLGRSLAAQAKLDEAESDLRRSEEIFRRAYDGEHKSTGLSSACLALVRARIDAKARDWKSLAVDGEVASARLNAAPPAALGEERHALASDCNIAARQLATVPNPSSADIREAAELAQISVKFWPENGDFWNMLGVVRYRGADYASAIRSLNKSLQLRDGGDSFDWLFLAMAEWQLHHTDRARAWYEKALGSLDHQAANSDELRRVRAEAAELLGMPHTPPVSRQTSQQVSGK